jgi:hypothetical protein
MTIPTTKKGLATKITRFKTLFKKEYESYGFISDGKGKRYFLFILLFLLGNDLKSLDYFQWYEREFPDDIGEPFQKLCWALTLYRMGRIKDAEYRLADTILSNIYLIPALIDKPVKKVDMLHGSNYAEPDYIYYLPDEIIDAITESDLGWLAEFYSSKIIQKILKRHIEIFFQLQNVRKVELRKPLVRESRSLIDELLSS